MKIKFILNYLLNFILLNKVKTIAIILLFSTIPFLNSIPDIKDRREIVFEHVKDKKTFYIVRDAIHNRIEYEVVTEKNPIIEDNNIISYRYDDRNILLWVVFISSLIFLLVGIFVSDDDFSFGLENVYTETLSKYIVCEFEEGKYYYFIYDRLLGFSDEPLHQSYKNLARRFKLYKHSQLNNYPIWETKKMNRRNKLNELGV